VPAQAAAKTPRKRNVDKAQAEAGKKAKAIKKAAVKAIQDLPHREWLDERPSECTDEDWKTGCQVRELRETGMSWLNIGNEMGFSAGKTGAGQARRAYKRAFGSLPETARSRATPSEGGSRRKKAEVVKGNAAEKLALMDDHDVVEYLAGKVVKWTTSTFGKDEGMEYAPADMECKVGKRPVVYNGKHGRYISFNEPEAGSRSIYLHTIHTVG
jgi:hypothetical protein